MQGERRWPVLISLIALVIVIAAGIYLAFDPAGLRPEATPGPYAPVFQGSDGGLEVWKWTDSKVECVIFTSSQDVDSVCHSVPGPTATPKVPNESTAYLQSVSGSR